MEIIEKLCDYLLANGPYCEGVLRVSGSSSAEDALWLLLRVHPTLVSDRTLCAAGCHVVAGVLKLAVRSRSEPIVAAASAVSAQAVVDSLRDPLAAKALHCLLHLVHVLLRYERTTQMTAEAFAVCLAPAICSDVLVGLDMKSARDASQRIVVVFEELISKFNVYYPHVYVRMSPAMVLAPRDASLLLHESEWLDVFLCTGGKRVKLSTGAVLIETGTCNRTLYRVMSGRFEVRAGSVVKYGSAGAIFGEMSLVMNPSMLRFFY